MTKPPARTSLSLAGTILWLALRCGPTDGSWIDPDTPLEARVVTPLPVVPNKPKQEKKDKNDDASSSSTSTSTSSHRRRHKDPTASPTQFPTYAPTATPSVPPSSATPPPSVPPRRYELVFSDEFNTPYRTFSDGHDPRWTALDKNDYTNDAQHYYSSANAFTDAHGNLIIRSEAHDTEIVGFDDVAFRKTKVTKHFRSAMLQSWNKFCFAGGVMEAEMSLPGKHDVGGLWPAFWLLGNLARHTYVGSSEHVWPWSSGVCTDKSRTAQLVSACDRVQHYGLHTGVGRGAPEIDIFEVQAGNIKANTGNFLKMPVGQPFMSASYQVAPGRLPRPGEGWWPAPGQWYDNLTAGTNTSLNIAFYGTYNHFLDDTDPAGQDYWSDAISFNRQLNESHFGQFHRYRLEWELPDLEEREDNNFTKTYGYLRWFLDDEFVMEVDGVGLNSSGTGSEISSEPMYILLNTAISSQWGFPQKCPSMCPCKKYNCYGGFQETCGFSEGFCDLLKEAPADYKINYVRVYQDPNDPKQKVGCSTPERPTRKFIEAHQHKYKLATDAKPLKPIQNGGAPCDPKANGTLPQTCGGETRGICQQSHSPPTCRCLDGWTGPHCMNPRGFDDIVWDPPESIEDLGFHGPMLHWPVVVLIGGLLGMLFVAPFVLRRRRRFFMGYKQVRSEDYERRVAA